MSRVSQLNLYTFGNERLRLDDDDVTQLDFPFGMKFVDTKATYCEISMTAIARTSHEGTVFCCRKQH